MDMVVFAGAGFAAVDFTAAVFTGTALMAVALTAMAREAIGDSYNELDYQSSVWYTAAASCC
jgi:hypothetical protein